MKLSAKILLLLLCAAPLAAAAQEVPQTAASATATSNNPLLNISAIDYTRIQLPPLHVLMENARIHSPQVNMYAANKEIEERELKTVRRNWLKYFKLNASYSYGSSDVTTHQFIENQYPMIQNVTGTDQVWWNVGANVSFPLDEIFNHRNRVKQQQKKVESIQYEVDRWHDDICLKIIDAYTNAIQYLSLLENASSAMVTAKAQYEFSKADFVNGKIDAQTLSRQKNIESSAVREYEETRAQVNRAILQLEVLSKTPIITPEDQLFQQ